MPETLLASQVSLPGTHNSLAMHGGDIAKCQSKTLAVQLEIGVRFFDVRLKVKNGILHVFHGICDQRITFQQVALIMDGFLERNPSEFLVVRVKNE